MPTPFFFWRNLLKCLPTTSTPNPTLSEPGESDPPPPAAAAAAAPSNIIFSTNYNSLFDISASSASTFSSAAAAAAAATSSESEYSSSDDDDENSPPPDLATVFASHRFFFSSPGLTNSISESHQDNKIAANNPAAMDGGVAVEKYSPDPYSDFRKSMEEMIESRRIKDARANWDYLHELLSCYLAMNPKHTHGYIISAFADIVVRLLHMPSSESTL